MQTDAEAIVRELFRVFGETGDIEAVLQFFHPDVEWLDNLVVKEALHGYDGFNSAMARLGDEGYTVESSPETYERLDDETVLASGYTRLVRGETFIDLPAVWAFVVRDGKVVKGSTAAKRREALSAIGRESQGSQ